MRTIGTEEEQLRLAVEVNQLLLDARSLARDEQVDDGLRPYQFMHSISLAMLVFSIYKYCQTFLFQPFNIVYELHLRVLAGSVM